MTDKLSHLLRNYRENSEYKFHELFIFDQELAKMWKEIKTPSGKFIEQPLPM